MPPYFRINRSSVPLALPEWRLTACTSKSPVPQKDEASTRVTTFFPIRLTPYGSESIHQYSRPISGPAVKAYSARKIPHIWVCCSEMYSCQALCASHLPAALCTKWIDSTLSLHRINVYLKLGLIISEKNRDVNSFSILLCFSGKRTCSSLTPARQ